jgi:hypothetical protein
MAERWSYLAQEEARAFLVRDVEFCRKAVTETTIRPDDC